MVRGSIGLFNGFQTMKKHSKSQPIGNKQSAASGQSCSQLAFFKAIAHQLDVKRRYVDEHFDRVQYRDRFGLLLYEVDWIAETQIILKEWKLEKETASKHPISHPSIDRSEETRSEAA